MNDPFSPLITGPTRRHLVQRTTVMDFDPSLSSENSQPLALGQSSGFINWLFRLILICLLILGGRLFYLQEINGQQYRQLADQIRLRADIILAPRGTIVDRYQKPIVENVPNFSIVIIPADLPAVASAKQATLLKVASTIGVPLETINQKIGETAINQIDPVVITEGMSYESALRAAVMFGSLTGVRLEAVPTRHYINGPTTAHLLGYIGKISPAEYHLNPQASLLDLIGKSGLENYYQSTITGQNGRRNVERDVHNRQQQILTDIEPVPGQSLVLTIDSELQQHLYDRLGLAIKQVRSPGGAAVAINPQNGEILALVSIPSYDNNLFLNSQAAAEVQSLLTDQGKPLLNRAISGQYPSGSIIKPLIATAALAEKIITPQTTVMSVGGFKIGGDEFPDWKAGGHGLTNVAKALAESVNTFFYAIGGGYQNQPGLGIDKMVHWLELFGWGSQLKIDLPGEVSGLVPTKNWRQTVRISPWRLGDTYHLAIGQGDLQVTPLQVANAMATIANGGTVYRPHLLKAILNENNQPIKTIGPEIIRSNFASSNTWQTVRQGMRQGVLSGSSRAMQSLPVSSAGKTGTAQFGNEGKTHAWYTTFAPYDQPTIAITILIEAGGEGNATALPVAKDVLQWYFTRPNN